jgi:hypothetical protein
VIDLHAVGKPHVIKNLCVVKAPIYARVYGTSVAKSAVSRTVYDARAN